MNYLIIFILFSLIITFLFVIINKSKNIIKFVEEPFKPNNIDN